MSPESDQFIKKQNAFMDNQVKLWMTRAAEYPDLEIPNTVLIYHFKKETEKLRIHENPWVSATMQQPQAMIPGFYHTVTGHPGSVRIHGDYDDSGCIGLAMNSSYDDSGCIGLAMNSSYDDSGCIGARENAFGQLK